ncbi:MAG: Trk system potassium transporter TrkA [Acidimicrobiia bacterium]|nr:Trk system potassium transporter TrkA [Acidimicrobiia bacterium]
MKIVIVGAGAVGSYLAQRFSLEGQDVVVIESDPGRAAQVQASLDALVITGNGASAATLEQAGLSEADLLVAVSSSDAVNVLACTAAAKLGIPRRVARVEDPELKAEVEALGVDLVIDPGEAAARDLLVLANTGHVAEMVEFADGGLVMVGAYLESGSEAAGATLADLRREMEGWHWLIAAVVRKGETLIGRGATTLEAGDHVLLIAEADRVKAPFDLLGLTEQPADQVFVLGGTRLAGMTAEMLSERGVHTTLIDGDPSRCRRFAEQLPHVVVVCGDPTDPGVLKEAGVTEGDAVLALTGWDGENLLSCLVAKALGAGEVICRFNDTDLVGLLGGSGIDATVSSRLSAANEILRFIRRGVIHSAITIPGSDAEALELEVSPNSPAVGKALSELQLPRSVIVGGVQRNGKAFVPRGNTVLEAGDHVIVIALPEGIAAVEALSG